MYLIVVYLTTLDDNESCIGKYVGGSYCVLIEGIVPEFGYGN
jgi:hypothetical protein